MFGGGGQTFEKTLRAVESWIPSKAYGHESKFQNELKGFLDEELNQGGDMLIGGGGHEHVVERESGRSRADLAVDDTVGIEMKRDLTNSQKKKLHGQIETLTAEYQYVIVCSCGIKDMDGWRDLKNKYEGGPGLGMDQSQVAFVHKKKENYGKDPNQVGGSQGLFGGDSLF